MREMNLRQLLPKTSDRMLAAVQDVMDGRKTWRQASIDHGVTESGIHYALKRARAASSSTGTGRSSRRGRRA